MSARSSKRTWDEISSDANEVIENIPAVEHMTNIEKSTFPDLCTDILLEILKYLRPVDLLYSLTNLCPHLDALLEPYTHTLDFRLMNKSYFQSLTQSLLPSLTNKLRVLRVSNACTFSQISELFYRLDWSHINQLESLTFDSIKSDELSRYFLTIHPLLGHLWRLSLTFDEEDKLAEKLLYEHLLVSPSSSLRNCFLFGITLDLSKFVSQKFNANLRELTITLASINDLVILFRMHSHLEILTCTIVDSTYTIDKIPSLEFLTILTLTIKQPIEFKHLQAVLTSQIRLQRLSLKAILFDKNSKQEIGGLELEKLFRTFSQLIELHFYLRCNTNGLTNLKADSLYLFSFTSHFWSVRSIEVFTYFFLRSNQRYIYTLPFAFDTFDLNEDMNFFLLGCHPYYYTNVRHLVLSSICNFNESTYSNMILKYFPKIKTMTFSAKPSSGNTIKILNNHQWVQQKSPSSSPSDKMKPYVYIRSSDKSTQWYCRSLDILSADQRLFVTMTKRARQLTIYEMTQQQLVNLTYFFPRIDVLTLHVETTEWFSSLYDWLYHLLTSMTSLFSLTIYYPKDIEVKTIHDSLASTLLAVKKHFYIKCNDGILNVWF